MDLHLIKATKENRKYLFTLRKLTMVEHLENSGQFLSDEEHYIRLNNAYECSHIIHYKGDMIGTLKYQETADKITVMQLQIHPDFQRKGFGSEVMQQVLNSAKHKTVELTVLKQNPALSLYKRLGFETFDEDEHEYHMRLIPDK